MFHFNHVTKNNLCVLSTTQIILRNLFFSDDKAVNEIVNRMLHKCVNFNSHLIFVTITSVVIFRTNERTNHVHPTSMLKNCNTTPPGPKPMKRKYTNCVTVKNHSLFITYRNKKWHFLSTQPSHFFLQMFISLHKYLM